MQPHAPALLGATLDLDRGAIDGVAPAARRLSDLRGTFADADAYAAALKIGDPVVYTVASVTAADGPGQLHYGLGTLLPGQIGAEYYFTKGHLHTLRETAEVYVGLRGRGALLLEDEHTGESTLVALHEGSVVYVPGFTAHRTINTGNAPLVYLGVYPAEAGHDYGAIRERNFQKVLVNQRGVPTLLDRAAFRAALKGELEHTNE